MFDSGVLVVQSLSHSEQAIVEDTSQKVVVYALWHQQYTRIRLFQPLEKWLALWQPFSLINFLTSLSRPFMALCSENVVQGLYRNFFLSG